MILVLNNKDSFVFNLSRYLVELGQNVEVKDSQHTTLDDVSRMAPSAIVISPGPCTPDEAGISLDIVRQFGTEIPILGVCLGHQVIAQAFGWQVVKSRKPTHGHAVSVTHRKGRLFEGLPQPLRVGLYHSLIAQPVQGATPLVIDAESPGGEVMAISHANRPIFGVQFHPESILSESGHALLENFLRLAGLKAIA
tara:strand:+ start:490 stop:1074 length:585 start_codon:yes stop_codon:yes gene_type:complete